MPVYKIHAAIVVRITEHNNNNFTHKPTSFLGLFYYYLA